MHSMKAVAYSNCGESPNRVSKLMLPTIFGFTVLKGIILLIVKEPILVPSQRHYKILPSLVLDLRVKAAM